MSKKMQSDTGEMDVQSLLDKVRLLERENKRLKEKSKVGDAASIFQKSVKIELPTGTQQNGKLPTQNIDMGKGINLSINSEITNTTQLGLWCEVNSPVEMDTVIIMSTGMKDPYGTKLDNTLVEFLRVTKQSTTGSKHFVTIQQRGYHSQKSTIQINIKIIRMALTSTNISDSNTTATVTIQNEKLEVDVPYVSKWSQFLQAYFASNMKEKANGIYPINDCSAVDFREMLDVIYPSSKPIDENNVEAMLALADRFIMPMLTRKCEVFLSKNTLHGITEIRMIGMADRFNLVRTRAIVLERLNSTALLRSKIIQAIGYESLSLEMKREVDARYVQLDVQERQGNQNGY